MTEKLSLKDLWDSAPAVERVFPPDQISGLPGGTRQYFEHAIAPGTKLASAVWLRMHGEIKLQRWFPFTAEQVISWGRGMIWSASTRIYGLPVRGSDRIVDGKGAMRWKLFGIIPIVTATGPDVSRSAASRVNGESVWLPSVLCAEDVSWSETDPSHLLAGFTAHGHTESLQLTVNDKGRLGNIKFPRWGNPEGADFNYVDFGGFVNAEDSFGGYTIPTHLRIGWYFGTDRFHADGEFFRVVIDEARYR